jgi:hypothetical protein
MRKQILSLWPLRLENRGGEGAPLSELRQVVPSESESGVQRLLNDLRPEGRIFLRGARRWARSSRRCSTGRSGGSCEHRESGFTSPIRYQRRSSDPRRQEFLPLDCARVRTGVLRLARPLPGCDVLTKVGFAVHLQLSQQDGEHLCSE